MNKTPEIIYLIHGEDIEGYPEMVWCEDSAPTYANDPEDAVKYVRADTLSQPIAYEYWWPESPRGKRVCRPSELPQFGVDVISRPLVYGDAHKGLHAPNSNLLQDAQDYRESIDDTATRGNFNVD
jgi:hypothetical protein